MTCELTAEGREVANEVADQLFEGAKPTQPFFTEHDLQIVGVGESRVAVVPVREAVTPDRDPLLQGDCVIKFERSFPPEQNRAEIANWRAAPPAVREVLAPIQDHGPKARWLLMPRAEEFGDPVDLVRIEDTLDALGWSCRGLHTENIGIFDGQPKALDYGFPCVVDGERVRVDQFI